MTVALSTRWTGSSPDEIVPLARDLDVRNFVFDVPPARARSLRRELKASGVAVAGVGLGAGASAADEDAARFASRLEAGIGAASDLRAGHVLIEAGAGDDAEEAAERIVRALHGASSAGTPMAIVNGGMLGLEETGWVLDDLRGLSLWFDPSVVDAEDLVTWTDRFAGRCAGCWVRRRHPEDLGLPWSTLAASLPRRMVWAFDPDDDLSRSDVADAVRYLRSVCAR